MSTAAARRLTAILHREEEEVVAECHEVGSVSQGTPRPPRGPLACCLADLEAYGFAGG